MKIEYLEIIGLNDSEIPIKIPFNGDVNIITGRNGSGKTTILKLMWYCISANIERAIREITFKKVEIVTSVYKLTVELIKTKKQNISHFILENPRGEIILEKKEPIGRESIVDEFNQLTNSLLNTSIFFPTFRRIEGGFSMTSSGSGGSRRTVTRSGGILYREQHEYGYDIQDALETHASRLSIGKHKFVSSISTVDIQQLVTRRHNNATTKVDEFSKSLSENIFSEIENYRETNSSESDALKDAISTLDRINQDVTEFEEVREKAFNSLSVLSKIIVTIFKHKGIRLNPRVTLGDIDQSINSDALSAGEKQMLSFLCYNALYQNCPFFIDEPELSLHVDWQRILIDVMLEQGTDNQLFIATHSPFIYSQYEDKEIMIGEDRGNDLV